jgi:hypothetical protein
MPGLRPGTVIVYAGGPEMYELAFFGRVRAQEKDGSFFIAGMSSSDPQEGSGEGNLDPPGDQRVDERVSSTFFRYKPPEN